MVPNDIKSRSLCSRRVLQAPERRIDFQDSVYRLCVVKNENMSPGGLQTLFNGADVRVGAYAQNSDIHGGCGGFNTPRFDRQSSVR